MYPPIHEKPKSEYSFDRLDRLWERYPQYHGKTTFATLEELLAEHESYQEGFEDYREEYLAGGCDRFLVNLSWAYLPDRIAKYLGGLPYYHNPSKTVCVRRNIAHMLDSGYFSSELELFLNLTRVIMPFFQFWYEDLALYEEKDGIQTNWRLERTKIRTKLTAEGIIKPKWKHELSLFHALRARYPDTLYQYRPEWLKRQSLDLYIPSLRTAIEYQGIQHYLPVAFFGGEEALAQRQELDQQKKQLCEENAIRLIEWPYDVEPTDENIAYRLVQNDLTCSNGSSAAT